MCAIMRLKVRGGRGVTEADRGSSMRDTDELRETLGRLDARGYKAYKGLDGVWELDGFTLYVDHVQGDPLATPTRVRARIGAQEVAANFPIGRSPESPATLRPVPPRRVVTASIDPSKGRRDVSVKTPNVHTLLFGTQSMDLSAMEQLRSRGQTRAIGLALAWIARQPFSSAPTIDDILTVVDEALTRYGLDAFSDRLLGDLLWFRRFELSAVLNRLRTLRVE